MMRNFTIGFIFFQFFFSNRKMRKYRKLAPNFDLLFVVDSYKSINYKF